MLTPSARAFLAKHEAHFTRDPLFGCWLWQEKDIDRHGYGTLWGKGGPRQAHREMYRELVGPIPEGRVLDHLCRNRACVRPDHLDPVKGSENDLRRSWRYRARQSKCSKGHDMSTCVTTPAGGRICRRCNEESPWRNT